MAIKIVTGGTDSLQDGTLVSSSNKITIPQLNTNVVVHMRCDDGYYSTNQTFTLPQYVSISFDNGSIWYTSANNPISAPEIEDINYKVLIKQTQGVANTAAVITTDGAYTAITTLSAPTLTATGGDTLVNLSWTAVTNRQYYIVQRATDSGFTANLTTLKSVSDAYTSTTLQDTGRTNGTTYYYRVKATGIGRYSDSAYSTSASATPAAGLNETFTSLDTTNTWVTVTSGSGTVTAAGGKAVINKPNTSSQALLIAKALPLTHGSTWTLTAVVDVSNEGAADDQHPVIALARKTSAPTSGDTFTDAYFPLRTELYRYSVDGRLYYRFKYVNSTPASVWYDFGGGGAWSTTFDGATDGTGSWKVLPGGNDQAQFQYVIEGDATNGVRFKVKSVDGVTTHDTSAWVPWASINGSGNYYAAFGAWQYSFTSAFSGTINVDSVVAS